MRPSKAVHALERVRDGLRETQKGFAKLCGCHCRTIQQIELGKLPLSRNMAMRVSERTGVSEKWLLANDRERKILDVFGKKWEPDKVRIEEFRKRWSNKAPMIRDWKLLVCRRLLEDYLRLRRLIESFSEQGKVMREWERYRREAFLKFLETYKPISERFGFNPKDLTVDDFLRFDVTVSRESLYSIEGDISALLDGLSFPPQSPRNLEETLTALSVELGGNDPYRASVAIDKLSDEDFKNKSFGEIKRLIGGNPKQSPKKQQRSRALRAA